MKRVMFVAGAAAITMAASQRAPHAGASAPQISPDTVSVLVLVPADSAAGAEFRRGLELGAAEAAASARLLGWGVRFSIVDVDGPASLSLPLARDGHAAPTAVVSFLDSANTVSLARALHGRSLALLNAGTSADGLRRSLCSASTFHLSPSRAMMRDAAVEVAAEDSLSDSPAVIAWHGRLERFGAGELNDRYRARFARDADQDSWLGWIAMKIVTEAALRSGSARASEVLDQLASPMARFDGHKGKPLTFRSWDRQLRQPVYVVTTDAAGKPGMHEAPADTGGNGSIAAEILDRLGDGPDKQQCKEPI